MFSFAAPWVFLLLPQPALLYFFAPPHRQRVDAIRIPFFRHVGRAAGAEPQSGSVTLRRTRMQTGLAILIWVLLVLAMARPERLGDPIVIEKSARDVVLAVDISGSMDQRDFKAADGTPKQRLEAVKDVLRAFIAALAAGLLTLAVAGPTWSRAPNPLIADTAPLVIALKVTDSMEEADLAPSRLDRAKLKITDLINTRAGAPTALIAYAGSAHRVAPLTEDANILRPLLEGLTPAVMPVAADAAGDALTLAQDILGDQMGRGAVLFVLDDIDPQQVSALGQSDTPLFFLTMLPDGRQIPQLDGLRSATIVPFSGDDRDIARLNRGITRSFSAALGEDDRVDWQDRA